MGGQQRPGEERGGTGVGGGGGEGRRVGVAVEVAAGGDHDEAIAYGGGPIDRHVGDSVRLAAPERPFAVPRGIVVPRNTSRTCVAGRIVSTDAGAMDGLRHMGGMMPVGQAAGVVSAGTARAVWRGRRTVARAPMRCGVQARAARWARSPRTVPKARSGRSRAR